MHFMYANLVSMYVYTINRNKKYFIDKALT